MGSRERRSELLMLRQAVNRLIAKRFKVKYGSIKERPKAAKKVEAIGGHQQMKDTTLLKGKTLKESFGYMVMATGVTIAFLVWWDVPGAYQRLVAPLITSPGAFLTWHTNRIKLLELAMLEDKLMLGKEPPSQYDNPSTYCNLIPGPLGTSDNFADFSNRLAAGFVLLKETSQIRFHNGKFLETMAVTTFSGSFEKIAKDAADSTTGLFKVAQVETLDNDKINQLLESNIDLVCLSDDIVMSYGMNCIPATTKFLHEMRQAKTIDELNNKMKEQQLKTEEETTVTYNAIVTEEANATEKVTVLEEATVTEEAIEAEEVTLTKEHKAVEEQTE